MTGRSCAFFELHKFSWLQNNDSRFEQILHDVYFTVKEGDRGGRAATGSLSNYTDVVTRCNAPDGSLRAKKANVNVVDDRCFQPIFPCFVSLNVSFLESFSFS